MTHTKPWYKCRRTLLATYSVTLLFCLGMWGKADVTAAISTIVLAVAGANASQSVFESRNAQPKQNTPPN